MKKSFRNIAVVAAVVAMCGGARMSALELQDFVMPQRLPASVGAVTPSTVDGESYYRMNDDGDRIEKVSYRTGEASEVFNSATARDCKVKLFEGFAMSADEGKILLWTNVNKIYRHSFSADYYVFEVRHNKLTKLTPEGGEEIATLSPDGRMVAFVKNNNVYIKKLDYDTQVAVTTDGAKNKIINAVPDWVYQEEFGMLNSFTWSPDNLMLAFIRFDESEVPMYSMTLYAGDCVASDNASLYPGRLDYKYPMAGEKNSVVSVLSYDVETRVVKTMKLPIGTDGYVPHIEFSTDPSRLMVSTLNRTQNDFHLYAVNPRSTIAKEVYSEQSRTWIDSDLISSVRHYPDFFVLTSEKSGYKQLYQYSNAGSLMKQLTSGEENVTAFYGYDSAKKVFYYQRTAGPLNRVVECVDARGKVTQLGASSGTNGANFSGKFDYYIGSYSDVKTPNRYGVYTSQGKPVRELENNAEYAAKYVGATIPHREFFTVESDGMKLNGFMVKPVDFDPSRKYPVIMAQYSGPGSQQVLNRWGIEWQEYFATQGYVVACVDGRGTGGREKSFQDCVYLNLGHYETIDQLAAARYMAQQPWVDASRIGIWGWSYGGYEVLMAMSHPDSHYAAGVSIAPVTSWRFYDT
ncbi:MAG: S9 family peptidase, partial [Muribaculaceae bacterium]|nr:S9 family peptidase [Muribaculaceae bacterium]